MRSRTEGRLKLAISGLVLVSYFGLTSTFRYSPTALLVPVLAILFMPTGEWLDRKFRSYRQLTSLLIMLYILSVPFIIRSYRLLDAVVSLVMFIQVYSLVHAKRERNYGHIMLMCFFMLLAASVLSPRAGIAVVYFFFVVLATWCLALLEMYSAERRIGPARSPIKVFDPRAGEGRRESPRTISWALSSMICLLGVSLVTLAGTLFFVTPRTEAGLLGAATGDRSFTTGLSAEVDLSSGGVLDSNASPVMRVQFPEEPDGLYAGDMLWRVTSLDNYTGKGWVRRGLLTPTRTLNRRTSQFKTDSRTESLEGLDRGSFGHGDVVEQEIFLDSVPEYGIPALQMVKSVIAMESGSPLQFRWVEHGDFTVEVNRRADRNLYLRAWSEVIVRDPAMLRAASEDYSSVMVPSDYRNLTYENLLPETRALVEQISGGAATPYDKVVAIESYFGGNGYSYSKDIPFLPLENPVDAFILEEKSGHCELYASALALMVRSLGIPARVVSGYRGGVFDEADRSYTITNDMAHLWAEVFFLGVGWVPFDPSPPEGVPNRLSIDSIARMYSRYSLKAQILWMSSVVSYAPSEANLFFRDVAVRAFRTVGGGLGSRDLPESEISAIGRFRGPVLLGLMVAMLVAVLFFVRRVLRGPRGRRAALRVDQVRAARVFLILVSRLKRFGVDYSGKTAEEISEALGSGVVDEPGSAEYVLARYNAVRFGRAVMTKRDFSELRRRVRALRPAPR